MQYIQIARLYLSWRLAQFPNRGSRVRVPQGYSFLFADDSCAGDMTADKILSAGEYIVSTDC